MDAWCPVCSEYLSVSIISGSRIGNSKCANCGTMVYLTVIISFVLAPEMGKFLKGAKNLVDVKELNE